MKLKNTRTVITALTREIKRLKRKVANRQEDIDEQRKRVYQIREAFSRLAPKAYKQFREELSKAAAKTDAPSPDHD